jgi:hypothetical protein
MGQEHGTLHQKLRALGSRLRDKDHVKVHLGTRVGFGGLMTNN